jgi:predicted RecB family nuclease
MRNTGHSYELSATDLVGHLSCRHLTNLDRAVADGTSAKPQVWDPLLEILRERGATHERKYVEHLTSLGLRVVAIEGVGVSSDAVAETIAAMKSGVDAIVQGALAQGNWVGRTDVLLKVKAPSMLGNWSYEPIDTKLARETKAGAVLQLCLYCDLLRETQGAAPEFMHVVAPWTDFKPSSYRFADYESYFRNVRRGLEQSLASTEPEQTYPDPKEHCKICRWGETCDKRRREDDHLCLVAGISKLQISELASRDIKTLAALAEVPVPLEWKPDRGSVQSLTRVKEQARIQEDGRRTGERRFEFLPIEVGFGLTLLPAPSPGDVFFDLEGDPFVGEQGLEYLFGYGVLKGDELEYRGEWAFSRADEKQAFERFVDFAMQQWQRHPDFHIYHYAPYEPSALKRLMGRYASRQEEVDRLLRARVFVDLYSVARNGVRASVESYSIKRLEPFCGFERNVPLRAANSALTQLSASLELDDVPSLSDKTKDTVLEYNKDDCRSAASLRKWLETHRDELIEGGVDVPRPEPGDDGAPDPKITDWLARITPIIETLTADVPVDPDMRDADQHARWILANIIDWHRRENKAVWWEYFRLSALSADELFDEKAGLSGLKFVGEAGGTARAPIHRYSFPPQETEFRGGEDLKNLGGAALGSVAAISLDDRTVDIKKRQDSVSIHPQAVFEHGVVGADVLADALARIGEYVVQNGLGGVGAFQSARALLLNEAPFPGGLAIRGDDETTLEAAIRIAGDPPHGVFPIQGPPGAGKTYTGARMICELVYGGKKVGITANSHKVIRNLIDAVIKAADDVGVDLQCCQKPADMEEAQHRLSFAKSPEAFLTALRGTASVGGGTAWLWARHDAFEAVDVLFVDEAAQMSLANVLAVSHAAKTVVLLGDPQQLDQPTQGTHPDGTGASALNHILGGEQILPPHKGLFLDETWRLHPDICAFTSEAFYAGKLRSKEGREKQIIRSSGPVSGSGLRYLAVEHTGNQTCSPEEAVAVAELVKRMLGSQSTWVDDTGSEHPLGLNDILIIAPYNAQVFEIHKHLLGARVGTVDKFQGQEAAVAIYSTATSSYADAPRGMEFLYSLNRLNVATSRARCVSILVSSPEIFEAECRSPRQMQLANAFCRYLEMAERLKI